MPRSPCPIGLKALSQRHFGSPTALNACGATGICGGGTTTHPFRLVFLWFLGSRGAWLEIGALELKGAG